MADRVIVLHVEGLGCAGGVVLHSLGKPLTPRTSAAISQKITSLYLIGFFFVTA